MVDGKVALALFRLVFWDQPENLSKAVLVGPSVLDPLSSAVAPLPGSLSSQELAFVYYSPFYEYAPLVFFPSPRQILLSVHFMDCRAVGSSSEMSSLF